MSFPTTMNTSSQELRFRRRLQRADAYQASGDFGAAINSLDEALNIQPEHVPTMLQLATLHLQQRQHTPARRLVLQALRGHLDSPKTALRLFNLLGQLGETKLMVEMVNQLPPNIWDSAKSLSELAQGLNLVNANDLAKTFAQAGLQRDPLHPPSLYMLATAEVFFGNLRDAAELVERCLALVPDDPGSHWLMSRLRLPEPELRIARIRDLLRRATDPEKESWLAYALHNELHDCKKYDEAWDALAQGCGAKRKLLNYSSEDNQTLYDALMSWQASEIDDSGYIDESITPIFVVGLHRSGTTLAERILSGHSSVTAAGETYDITTQLRRVSGYHFSGETDLLVVQNRKKISHIELGEGYLKGIKWRSGGSPFITDKLPSNFLNIGFIAQAMPKAKFIHLVRDPVDVGFSNLRTLFNLACPYSYDQIEFAEHFWRYKALMQHWHEILPGRILDVRYDRLVTNPVDVATEMAQFCDLEFEPDMIAIEKRTDAVSTASSVMMRDGIRTDRGKVWKHYERHLGPMLDLLADSG